MQTVSNSFKHSRNESNNTSTTEDYEIKFIGHIIKICILTLLGLLAIVYLIIFLSQKPLRSNRLTWLVANICFSGLLFSLEGIIMSIVDLINPLYPIMPCRVNVYLDRMSICRMTYAHATTAFCRFLSVQYSYKRWNRSTYWIVANIILTWIAAALTSLPHLFIDDSECSYGTVQRFLETYGAFTALIIPIAIVVICNLRIFFIMIHSGNRVHNLNNNNNNINPNLRKREMHFLKIMSITFFLYGIAIAPVVLGRFFIFDHSYISSILSILFHVLPPLSLIANTAIIIHSDASVRRTVLKYLQYTRKLLFFCKY